MDHHDWVLCGHGGDPGPVPVSPYLEFENRLQLPSRGGGGPVGRASGRRDHRGPGGFDRGTAVSGRGLFPRIHPFQFPGWDDLWLVLPQRYRQTADPPGGAGGPGGHQPVAEHFLAHGVVPGPLERSGRPPAVPVRRRHRDQISAAESGTSSIEETSGSLRKIKDGCAARFVQHTHLFNLPLKAFLLFLSFLGSPSKVFQR